MSNFPKGFVIEKTRVFRYTNANNLNEDFASVEEGGKTIVVQDLSITSHSYTAIVYIGHIKEDKAYDTTNRETV